MGEAIIVGRNTGGNSKLGLSPPLIAEYKVAGSYTWNSSAHVGKKVLVAMIGGGGAGGLGGGTKDGNAHTSGGGSGHTINLYTTIENTSYSIVVGAGGKAPIKLANVEIYSGQGGAGGTSSFHVYNIYGGSGGSGSNGLSTYTGSAGGQGSLPSTNNLPTASAPFAPFGGMAFPTRITSGYEMGSTTAFNFFIEMLKKNILPFCICAGQNAWYNGSAHNQFYNPIILPNGNRSSHSLVRYERYSNYFLEKGTDPGCGGGGLIVKSTDGNLPQASGSGCAAADGCDGGIFIYDLSNWEG